MRIIGILLALGYIVFAFSHDGGWLTGAAVLLILVLTIRLPQKQHN